MSSIRTILFVFVLCPGLGMSAEHVVNIDTETEIRLLVFTPNNSGDGPWPLALLIPAGSGQEFILRSQFWLGKELTDRGWVIAVPISRDGNSVFGEDNKDVSKVISQLQTDPNIKIGKSLLLGISRGGTSALEIASKNPGNYFGVVAVPGRLKESGPLPALQGLPIFLRIADRDNFRWHKRLPEMTQRLESAGARVDAALVENARHIFRINWDELEPWLNSLK